MNCMKSVEYDTEVQIQQDYDAVYEDGFWEKSMMENTATKF